MPISSCQKLWLDKCKINSASLGPFQATEMWATHCAVTNLRQGFRASTITDNQWFNVRGCNLEGFTNTILVQLTMGNYHPNTNIFSAGVDGYRVVFDISGQGAAHDFQICYNNYFGGIVQASGAGFDVGTQAFVVSNGLAVVQNVIESCGAAAASVAQIASAQTRNSTNVIFWNNIVLGERIADVGSSGSENQSVYREKWSLKNNIMDLSGIKKDFNTTTSILRIDNWDLMNMVDCSGNIFVECRVNAAAGTFPPEFSGLNSNHPGGGTPLGAGSSAFTNVVNYPRFVDRKAYDGAGTIAAGGGKYRHFSDAPGFQLETDWLIAFDQEGFNRSAIDPPGTHSSGHVKKGGFF